jgi:hypothetical protein
LITSLKTTQQKKEFPEIKNYDLNYFQWNFVLLGGWKTSARQTLSQVNTFVEVLKNHQKYLNEAKTNKNNKSPSS